MGVFTLFRASTYPFWLPTITFHQFTKWNSSVGHFCRNNKKSNQKIIHKSLNPWKKNISKLKNYIKRILLPKKTPFFSTKKKHRLSHEIVKLNPCKPVKALKLQPKRGGQANSIRGWNFLPMLEVTIRLWKGHVNSPSQKGAQRMARHFFVGGLFHKPMEKKKGSRKKNLKKNRIFRGIQVMGVFGSIFDEFSYRFHWSMNGWIFMVKSTYSWQVCVWWPFLAPHGEWVSSRGPWERRLLKVIGKNHLAPFEDFWLAWKRGSGCEKKHIPGDSKWPFWDG